MSFIISQDTTAAKEGEPKKLSNADFRSFLKEARDRPHDEAAMDGQHFSPCIQSPICVVFPLFSSPYVCHGCFMLHDMWVRLPDDAEEKQKARAKKKQASYQRSVLSVSVSCSSLGHMRARMHQLVDIFR